MLGKKVDNKQENMLNGKRNRNRLIRWRSEDRCAYGKAGRVGGAAIQQLSYANGSMKTSVRYFLISIISIMLIMLFCMASYAETQSPAVTPDAETTQTVSSAETPEASDTAEDEPAKAVRGYGWLLDIAVLGTLVVFAFYGIYKGFLASALHVIGSVLAWVISLIFYPVLSGALASNTGILNTLLYYTEGSSNISDVQLLNQEVTALPKETIQKIVADANLPQPLGSLLESNILKQVFPDNISTLAEYFDYTLANIMLNIISFLLIFIAIKLIFFLVIKLTDVITRLPVLKQLNKTLGAAAGVLRGVFLMFIVFSIVPIILTVIPNAVLTATFENSLFSAIFYKGNIISNLVSGIV